MVVGSVETLNYQHLYISIKYQVDFVFNYL